MSDFAPDPFNPACPSRRLLDRIGDRWTVLIVTTAVLANYEVAEIRTAGKQRRLPGTQALARQWLLPIVGRVFLTPSP